MAKQVRPKNYSMHNSWFAGRANRGDYIPSGAKEYFSERDFNNLSINSAKALHNGTINAAELLVSVKPNFNVKSERANFFSALSAEDLQALVKVESGVTLNRALGYMWNKYTLDATKAQARYTVRAQNHDAIKDDRAMTPAQFSTLVRAWDTYNADSKTKVNESELQPSLGNVITRLESLSAGRVRGAAVNILPMEDSQVGDMTDYRAKGSGRRFFARAADRLRSAITGNIRKPLEQKGTLYYKETAHEQNNVNAVLRGFGEQLVAWRVQEMEEAGIFSANVAPTEIDLVKNIYKKATGRLVAAELAKLTISDPKTAKFHADTLKQYAADWLDKLPKGISNSDWFMPHVGSAFTETMIRVTNGFKISPSQYLEISRSVGDNINEEELQNGFSVSDVLFASRVMPEVELAPESAPTAPVAPTSDLAKALSADNIVQHLKKKVAGPTTEENPIGGVIILPEVVVVHEPKPDPRGPVTIDDIEKKAEENAEGEKIKNKFNDKTVVFDIEKFIYKELTVETDITKLVSKGMFATQANDLIKEVIKEKETKLENLISKAKNNGDEETFKELGEFHKNIQVLYRQCEVTRRLTSANSIARKIAKDPTGETFPGELANISARFLQTRQELSAACIQNMLDAQEDYIEEVKKRSAEKDFKKEQCFDVYRYFVEHDIDEIKQGIENDLINPVLEELTAKPMPKEAVVYPGANKQDTSPKHGG